MGIANKCIIFFPIFLIADGSHTYDMGKCKYNVSNEDIRDLLDCIFGVL